jgi:hypothetical protein
MSDIDTTRVAAFDLETTALDDDVPASFDDLSTWTIFAIGVGFRPHASASVETEILIRGDGSPRAERKLIARFVNWLRDHEPVDVLADFNGSDFDIPVLENRADALMKSDCPERQTLSFALYDALDVSHRDLFAELKEQTPADAKWPSLDEALEARDIDVCGTPKLDGEPATGADMPELGRRVLDGTLTERQRIALMQYIDSDIRPLFALMDCLDEERRERIEAGAAAVAQRGQSATNTGGER